MVTVTVTYEDVRRIQLAGFNRSLWIAGQKWIEEKFFRASLKISSCVAKIGESHRVRIKVTRQEGNRKTVICLKMSDDAFL
jgi:hypothetical protein